jgi:hypothetical protein
MRGSALGWAGLETFAAAHAKRKTELIGVCTGRNALEQGRVVVYPWQQFLRALGADELIR